MESNLSLVSASDSRMLDFKGAIESERWGVILKELDDFSRREVQIILGDDQVNNEFRDKGAFNLRRESIERNLDFLFNWIHLKEAPNNKWWEKYIVKEGYSVPRYLPNIPIDRIQVLPLVIIKATKSKSNPIGGGRASGSSHPQNHGEAGIPSCCLIHFQKGL
ncbi:hypothetical protein SUGI_0050870 [Cryptomeria japonica]|nr:hypothetical protein SUGI_0050870 [Cryptomeria japonica]